MSEHIVISGLSQTGPAPVSTEPFGRLDFETRRELGKKGTRNMDRLTALAINGMSDLMPELGVDQQEAKDDIGIVLGTAQGSMDSIVRFTYETLAYDRPDYVNPALFPNTVMNCAAGHAAIWYRLRGLNATISCHEMSFLAALEYSHLQLRQGKAKTLVTGGVEELSAVNEAAITAMSGEANRPQTSVECSLFVTLESAATAAESGRKVLAEICAVRSGFDPETGSPDALAALIRDVLTDGDVAAEDIAAVSISATRLTERETEIAAVEDVFGVMAILDVGEQLGNGGSAHNALQLTALLNALAPGALGLVVARERHGNISALVVRKAAS
ncbi:MAG: beta-ketoacyl synthase N-terminal-like domain-containing protein [Pseudomonadota bacterium]